MYTEKTHEVWALLAWKYSLYYHHSYRGVQTVLKLKADPAGSCLQKAELYPADTARLFDLLEAGVNIIAGASKSIPVPMF